MSSRPAHTQQAWSLQGPLEFWGSTEHQKDSLRSCSVQSSLRETSNTTPRSSAIYIQIPFIGQQSRDQGKHSSPQSLSLSLSLYPVCTARFLWRAHGCTELSGPEGRRTKHDPSAAMDASYRAPVCVPSSNMAAPRSYHPITVCVHTAVTRR
ncbi:hypothetical protein EYF80_038918 [Liparis tanakae]|uniref:Uncharacterized protein n=1 Tax=Liparis tanakae TaxID=230148 RepID=A0A4Z2GDU1_9TELE|nr:hypothetical protein EYF80_038918 [Liparis tanakae]